MTDMTDIAEFLYSMDEPAMATEVLATHNRLELLIQGIERTCYEAQVQANMALVKENEELKAMLAEVMERRK